MRLKNSINWLNISKLSFTKNRILSMTDEILLRLNPTKRQFDFMIQIQFVKERQIKQKLIEGIKTLLDAREKIRVSIWEFITLREYIIKSKIYTDSQFINGVIKEIVKSSNWNNPYEVLKISKNKEHKLIIDLSSDEIAGSFFKRWLSSQERKVSLPYEQITINL